jgi:membrane fusion protein, copper/silver efflux system
MPPGGYSCPEWAAAQEEFLALKRSGDAGLLAAARQRLRLTGMPAASIAQVERSGKVQPNLTLTSPISGVLQELNVRDRYDGGRRRDTGTRQWFE